MVSDALTKGGHGPHRARDHVLRARPGVQGARVDQGRRQGLRRQAVPARPVIEAAARPRPSPSLSSAPSKARPRRRAFVVPGSSLQLFGLRLNNSGLDAPTFVHAGRAAPSRPYPAAVDVGRSHWRPPCITTCWTPDTTAGVPASETRNPHRKGTDHATEPIARRVRFMTHPTRAAPSREAARCWTHVLSRTSTSPRTFRFVNQAIHAPARWQPQMQEREGRGQKWASATKNETDVGNWRRAPDRRSFSLTTVSVEIAPS